MKCTRWRSNRSKSVNEHLILPEHQDWPIVDVLCADDTLLCVSDGPNSASLRRHVQVIIVDLFCLSSLPVTSCPVSALPVVEVHDKVTNNKLGVCSDTRRPNTHYYSIFYSLIWMMSSQGWSPVDYCVRGRAKQKKSGVKPALFQTRAELWIMQSCCAGVRK